MSTACTAILTNTDGSASAAAYIVGIRGDDTTIYDGRDGRLLCEIDWTDDCVYIDEKAVPMNEFLQPTEGGRLVVIVERGPDSDANGSIAI